MPRSAPLVALFSALLSLSACGGPDCQSGTLVAALTYDAAAMTADTLRVRGTINGQTMTASEPYAAQAQIRVPFPDVSYSEGLVVDVLVEARKGDAVVASAARSGYALPATCAVLPLAFDETGTQFTLSGQVSGLVGSGLVLANGTAIVPVAASGPFAFPTAIASGDSYDVTVATQPSSPTQACAVTNGHGVIDDADVTGVMVACSTSTYTVSGAISGLMSDGLELLETSSSQIVTLSQFGTDYSFPTPLASGSTYTVVVHQQPTTQMCTFTVNGQTVTSVSGPVTDMDVTAPVLTCVGD